MDKEEKYLQSKREEIAKSLAAHHITGELAWWLACLAVDIQRLKELNGL